MDLELHSRRRTGCDTFLPNDLRQSRQEVAFDTSAFSLALDCSLQYPEVVESLPSYMAYQTAHVHQVNPSLRNVGGSVDR